MSVFLGVIGVALVALVLFLFVGVLQRLKVLELHVRDIQRRATGTPIVPAVAPEAVSRSPLAEFDQPERSALLFLSADCSRCRQFIRKVRSLQGVAALNGYRLSVLVLRADDKDRLARETSEAETLEVAPELFSKYAVPGTPYLVLCEQGHVVLQAPVQGLGRLKKQLAAVAIPA